MITDVHQLQVLVSPNLMFWLPSQVELIYCVTVITTVPLRQLQLVGLHLLHIFGIIIIQIQVKVDCQLEHIMLH